MKKLLAAALASALAITLVGCSLLNFGTAKSPTQNLPTPAIEKVSAELQPFYSQTVEWVACGTEYICTGVAVPMNWNDPGNGQTVTIAVTVHRASDANNQNFLFTNPGGPGASGYDFVKDQLTDSFSKRLVEHFNIVGFDPRGVQRSEAITCLNMRDTEEFLYGDSGFPVGSPQDLAASKVAVAKFTAACKKRSGPILQFTDTVSAARDIDILRAALGAKKLDYLGFSYGTALGNTYATLYPKNVGRMVLDGAEDPTDSDEVKSLNQLKGFDINLRDYLANCLSQQGCPFTGSIGQAQSQLSDLLLAIESQPLPTKSKRKLTIQASTTGLLMALYSDDFWPYLTDGLTEALAGNGDTLLALADAYNDRASTGDFLSNGLEAFYATSCLDNRSDAIPAAMAAQNKKVLAASKVLGRYWQNGALVCSMWPYPVAKHPASYAAKGAPTIMVVGTTKDPATPYSQAVKLANEVLANGFLVTYNGDGHTAYGRGNSCINDTVDAFLLDGKLPNDDPDC